MSLKTRIAKLETALVNPADEVRVVRVRHIVVSTRVQAQAVLAAIAADNESEPWTSRPGRVALEDEILSAEEYLSTVRKDANSK